MKQNISFLLTNDIFCCYSNSSYIYSIKCFLLPLQRNIALTKNEELRLHKWQDLSACSLRICPKSIFKMGIPYVDCNSSKNCPVPLLFLFWNASWIDVDLPTWSSMRKGACLSPLIKRSISDMLHGWQIYLKAHYALYRIYIPE